MRVKLGKLDMRGCNKKKAARRMKAYHQKVQDYALFLSEDYDFDWSSILRILSYKLKRFHDHVLDHKAFKGYEKKAADVKYAMDLIDRVRTHDYDEEHLKSFVEKYGEPTFQSYKESDGTDCLEVLYKGKPATKKMNRERIACSVAAAKAQQADVEKAFEFIGKNILTWWC
jgi:hypothetical protein